MKPLAFVLFVSTLLLAQNKSVPLEWKTGTLIDQSAQRRCKESGSFDHGTGNIGERCVVSSFYKVDAGEMIYTFQRDTHNFWDKELNVTVNARIKYALKGKKFYLQDEEGKAHEVSVFQKALKIAPK